ncbi:MAG: hypothetical protein QE277_06375 [Flectobacillus sp.]|nr:hypothetical protein [Flectobacillus sp.]
MKKNYILTFITMVCLSVTTTSFAQLKVKSNKDILFELKVNDENKTVLKWVTAEGHTTSRFIIQRSKDNETYFDIREIEVKQVSSEDRLQYTFTDYKILRESEFYRIMEYEQDGKVHVYAPISAKANNPVSVSTIGDKNIIRVAIQDGKNLVALLGTSSGLGVPCDFEIAKDNNLVIKPSYTLMTGNYVVKLRSSAGEQQYKFFVRNDDIF